MNLKFKTIFRGSLLLLFVILFWSVWAEAQGNRTNVPVVLETTNPTAKPLINLTGVFQENETLLTFGLDRVEFLQKLSVGGQPRWKYLASFIYIVLAFYISKFFDFLTRVWLKKLAEKTNTKLDDLLLELLHGPVKIVSFVIFLNIGLSVFSWPAAVEQFFAKGLNLIVVVAFVYVLLKGIDLTIGIWKSRVSAGDDRGFDQQLFPILKKSLKVFVLIVAFLFVCDNVFNYNIKTILASLSIGGLALGLAAQDTLSNFFGAVVVFVDKPFRVGDIIKLSEVEGVVEAIGVRSTRVRNPSGHLITVPNKTMGNATITNISRRPNIKSETNIGLTYDMSVEKLQRALSILEKIYRKHPMTHDVLITFNKFADSALNIQVIHWWKSTNPKEQLHGMQELNLVVKRRFDEEGISFAFPSQTIYLKQDSEWRMAPGTEPKDNLISSKA
ncbi:MAG: mechanosensitive ion channel family protein [Verrucomicrobiota bacterium]